MSEAPTIALPLLQAGFLVTALLLARRVVRRHVAIGSVPLALRGRLATSDRVCPVLLVVAVALVGSGAVLYAFG